MIARAVRVSRRSKETSVRVQLRTVGPPGLRGSTGEAFLDHLWDAFARYAGLACSVSVDGSDAHHRTEDCALALGRALRRSVAERPVRRIGEATVPMDEALVQVVVDLVDRPYFEADLDRRTMANHALRSFALEARLTLHQRTLRDGDAHHVEEATFKALGRAWAAAALPERTAVSAKGKVRWGGDR